MQLMSTDHKALTSSHGDVKTLLSFRKAQIIYDLTFYFAHNFLSKGDRTVDQMIQAARSGKQNIAVVVLYGLLLLIAGIILYF